MAFWVRAHLIKATLVAGFLLLLLNVYNYVLDTTTQHQQQHGGASSLMHTSYALWPKRTHSSSGFRPSHISKATNNSNIRPPNGVPVAIQPAAAPDSNDLLPAFPSAPSITSASSAVLLADIRDQNETQPDGDIIGSNVINDPAFVVDAQPSVLQTIMTTLGLRDCPPIPPDLDGAIAVNASLGSGSPDEQLDALQHKPFARKLQPGGWYRPTECAARERVAIVVPYRDRAAHLPVFLANLHPLLQKQQIEYGMFLVEQVADGLFNRAALMNVGFVEAMKMAAWDCFIFHDIDLLPLDDRNLYTCPDQPRHMSVAVDTMGFKLPYSSIFGGVSALTVAQFKRVNGFSNSFWGWGGEDDDMSNRLRHCGYHIARYPVNIARYMMLTHRKEKANPKRYENLVSGAKKFDVEGLNSLRHRVQRIEKKVLYTWIVAEIIPESAS